jgi:hypothetical protein
MDWTALHGLCHRPDYRVGEELARMRLGAKKDVDAMGASRDHVGEVPAPPPEEAAPETPAGESEPSPVAPEEAPSGESMDAPVPAPSASEQPVGTIPHPGEDP